MVTDCLGAVLLQLLKFQRKLGTRNESENNGSRGYILFVSLGAKPPENFKILKKIWLQEAGTVLTMKDGTYSFGAEPPENFIIPKKIGLQERI